MTEIRMRKRPIKTKRLIGISESKYINRKRDVDKVLDMRIVYGVLQFRVKWLPLNHHVVEEVIGEKVLKNGNLKFLVKWKGFDTPVWESKKNLMGCKEAVGDFVVKKYGKYIKDVVVQTEDLLKLLEGKDSKGIQDDSEVIQDDSDDSQEDSEETEKVWISASNLDCDEEIKDYYLKVKKQPDKIDSILGPAFKLGDEIVFLVKCSTEESNVGDSILLSTLKERFPTLFLDYLEKYMVFPECVEKGVKKTKRGRPSKKVKQEEEVKEEDCDDDEEECDYDDEEEYDVNAEYVVQEVLKKNTTKDGRVEYLLKWAPSINKQGKMKIWEDSWQPPQDLETCPKLLLKFEENYCVGLRHNYDLHHIIDVKKTLDGQRYVEVMWKVKHGVVDNELLESNTEYVFYEVIKKKFKHQLIDHLCKKVQLAPSKVKI